MRDWFRRLRRSVFTRLLLGLLAVGLLVNLVVFAFFAHFRHDRGASYHRILTHYVDTLVAAIGAPPSPAAARAIAAATGLVIRYTGRDGAWTVGGDPVDLGTVRRRHLRQVDPGTTFGYTRGQYLVTRAIDGGELVFTADRFSDLERRLRRLLVVLLCALTAIVVMAYLFIRHLFKPLRGLREGVDAVHRGDLDYRVPATGAQEFRDLAAAFNGMTERVQQTMDSKARLLVDVSHELRSPITRMKLSADMLPDGDLKTSLKEDLEEMAAMVTTILESARMQHLSGALDKQPVPLMRLASDAAGALAGRPPGITVSPGPSVVVPMDAERMGTVVRNVLDNALKYSPPGSPPVTLTWRIEGNRAEIAVSDHGVGISPEAIHRVFEPFFREDDSRSRSTGGFGLGLSLCKAIIAAHDGTIAIDSTPDAGTTVTIRLPLA